MSAQPMYGDPVATRTPKRSARLRVLPIPTVEPEPLTASQFAELLQSGHGGGTTYTQSTLPVDFARHEGDPHFAPQPTPSRNLPDAAQWSRQVLRVMLEVMDGSRPARQLNRWVTHPIHDRAARQGIVARRRGGRARKPNVVLSVHVCAPVDGVAEVAALVVHNGRHRAVALRLNGIDGRWMVTVLEMG